VNELVGQGGIEGLGKGGTGFPFQRVWGWERWGNGGSDKFGLSAIEGLDFWGKVLDENVSGHVS
jgi:hypothetical protein